jgi:hypothetical protein
MKKIISAITAAALLASAPAVAQAASVPVPATEAGAGTQGANAQFEEMGPAIWIVGAIVVGLAIWGIVELIDDDDDDDLPVSPLRQLLPTVIVRERLLIGTALLFFGLAARPVKSGTPSSRFHPP